MTYEILIGALALVGMLAGVVSPIIKLNNNITPEGCHVRMEAEIAVMWLQVKGCQGWTTP